VVWHSASAVRGYPFSDVVAFVIDEHIVGKNQISHSLMKHHKPDRKPVQKDFPKLEKKLQLFVEISSGEMTASVIKGSEELENVPTGIHALLQIESESQNILFTYI